ncbi:MAG: hypothetical protein SH847_09580 [Roseiflexaceae bacterium]|nr:hypothetical protein [Roseiflexaceae bacterium]
MAHRTFPRRRRSLIIGAGVLAVASAGGLLAWNASDHVPLMDIPRGWYLLSRPGPSAGERQLVALHNQGMAEHLLETEVGTTFLSAAVAPDGRSFALLKRVMRGSMPTDAVGLYDNQTFRRLAVVEVQIAFQRVPTFSIGWSADTTQLAVPYDNAGRTLIFGVNGACKLSLQSMVGNMPACSLLAASNPG